VRHAVTPGSLGLAGRTALRNADFVILHFSQICRCILGGYVAVLKF
jgi:hypothetical protein